MTKRELIALDAESLDEIMHLTGDCFIYNGASYHGIINEVEFEEVLMQGGIFNKLGAIIVVPKRSLCNKPIIGETLIIDYVLMRIERVKGDETAWEITCVTAAA
jgi:hypothetical protein